MMNLLVNDITRHSTNDIVFAFWCDGFKHRFCVSVLILDKFANTIVSEVGVYDGHLELTLQDKEVLAYLENEVETGSYEVKFA